MLAKDKDVTFLQHVFYPLENFWANKFSENIYFCILKSCEWGCQRSFTVSIRETKVTIGDLRGILNRDFSWQIVLMRIIKRN